MTPWSGGSSSRSCPRDLREVFADPESVAELRAVPEGEELLTDLAAVLPTGGPLAPVPQRRRPGGASAAPGPAGCGWFRLAGNAPRPEMFEMDDVAPSAFDVLA